MTTERDTYSLEPTDIDASTWCYEEPKGLLIVHECRTLDGKFIQTDQFVVPWKLLRRTVSVHEAIRRKRVKP